MYDNSDVDMYAAPAGVCSQTVCRVDNLSKIVIISVGASAGKVAIMLLDKLVTTEK
jgi:hypothetical protein